MFRSGWQSKYLVRLHSSSFWLSSGRRISPSSFHNVNSFLMETQRNMKFLSLQETLLCLGKCLTDSLKNFIHMRSFRKIRQFRPLRFESSSVSRPTAVYAFYALLYLEWMQVVAFYWRRNAIHQQRHWKGGWIPVSPFVV